MRRWRIWNPADDEEAPEIGPRVTRVWDGPTPAPGEKVAVIPLSEVEVLIEAARQFLHQVDPQVTGPMSEKAVSPDRRKLWADRLHDALKPFEEAQ